MASASILSTKQQGKIRLYSLSCGYIKKYFNVKNIKSDDIGQIVFQFLSDDVLWTFDCSDESQKHKIENNGKTIKCRNCNYKYNCYFGTFSFGMKPQSGKYKIKFRIDKIFSNGYANIIGIISENSKQNGKSIQNQNKNGDYDIYKFTNRHWSNDFYDYIGWSADSYQDEDYLPNGLFCGAYDSRQDNIFRKNKFIYSSNNENYPTRLPGWQTDDIVVLEYDSHLSILSFSKENDNGKLDACIGNLPTNETFYWFVGHCQQSIDLTVVS